MSSTSTVRRVKPARWSRLDASRGSAGGARGRKRGRIGGKVGIVEKNEE